MDKKLLFIPNWNGHLYLYEEIDISVNCIYNLIKTNNKELIDIEKNNITNTDKLIQNSFIKCYENNEFVFSICGDHSNTYSLFSALKRKQENVKLVIFDAHPDVEVSTDLVSHEDYLRNLIDNEIVKPEDIYLFGIRTFSRTELDYLIEKKINFMTINEILKDKNRFKNVLESIKDNIYLSIDIDVLDPDDAPGTYYKEWCGLYIEELLDFINILKSKVIAGDVCEYYFQKDKNSITQNNLLKIINIFLN